MRDALVAWADGALIPGRCRSLEDSSITIPCAYTETYGNGDNVLVFTHEGISFGDAEDYGLPTSLVQEWENSATALVDSQKFKELLREHSLTSLMLTAPCSAPDVVLRKNGPRVARYAQGMWWELLRNPRIIPNFPNQETCFEWLALTTKQNGAVKADELFELLEAQQLSKWLKIDEDWLRLTKFLNQCELEGLDDVKTLPVSTDDFIAWLFSSSKLRETNFRTLLTFMVADRAPEEGIPDRLHTLVKSWQADDKDMFYRARSVIKNWPSLITVLCSMAAPGENIRNSIWTFFENAFSREEEFKSASMAIGHSQILPDEGWIRALPYFLNQKKLGWGDVPEKWALGAVQAYCENHVTYQTSGLLHFAKPYFQTTEVATSIPLFENVVSKIVEIAGPSAISQRDLYDYSMECWPSKKPIWDVCIGLDLSLADWGRQASLLVQKTATLELPEGLSENYESDSF